MAKHFKLLDPQQRGPSTSVTSINQTHWNLCVLCQMDTTEPLHCPADSKRSTGGSGYQTLADNLLRFSEIDCLPKSLDMSRLDDGEGIESTFQHHRAKWHDSCRLQYNKTQLIRAEKRKTTSGDTEGVTRKYTRQSVDRTESLLETCFFCDKPAGNESLRKASTFDLDRRVRKCALKLEDKPLIAKLSAGDMMAQDALYHVKCLVSLYNKARDTKRTLDDQDDINHGIALGELVSYIDDARMDALVAPVFKLADLTSLYNNRLKQLGTVLTGRVHSTKLKHRIMTYFPDMEEHKPGRDVLLAFNEDIGSALHKACEHDADSDGVHLARAANIVRRDMLKMKTAFSGSFDALCQEQSVPNSLVALVAMILNGPTIQEQSSHSSVSTPTLTISQLLMFNSYARRRQSTSIESTKHGHNRETPVPVYLGMLMHTKTRKRDLVDTLFHLGLSVSYDRVLSISTDLGNSICRFFQQEGAVCPPELKSGLFTTGAVDNIDHNPSSTSAQDSFHGTGISLFQHPNSEVRGVQRLRVVVSDDVTTTATTAHLPESYTTVPPVVLGKREPPMPKLAGPNRSDCQLIPQAMQVEYRHLTMKTVLLNSNYEMPVLGLGTWQSGAGQVKTAILHAFSIGYRHIDCASIYGNEAEIGEALQEALGPGKGLKREEIFVTSKLWNCNHHSADVEDACRKSLTQLKLDYLDLYLIHWPYSFGHGGENFPRTETGEMQYDVVDYRETWRAMENLVSAGLVRSIGLSNFNARQIDEIIASSTIRPAVLQVECHPYLGQTRLLAHCQEHHIVMTAYSPLGSPNRGWKMVNEPVLLLEPKVVSIAHRHSRSVAQVLLRWLLQRDITTIPKSITPSRIEENAKVFDFELSEDEMAELNSLDRGCRYIEPLIEVDGKKVPRDAGHPHYPFNEPY